MEYAQKKKPSYLSQVKEELLKIIVVEDYALNNEEAEKLWNFLSQKMAQSYWNGVSAGSSGRVKPHGFNAKGKPASRQ